MAVGTIPFTRGRAFLHGRSEDVGGDPESRCFQLLGPRATYLPFPFQIIQTRTTILMAYEFGGVFRFIHLDKARTDLFNIDTATGQSLGSWEGDTLVVDTRWFS